MKNNYTAVIKQEGEWWHSPALNKRSAVPRHREIDEILAKKICMDLGRPAVK